MVQVSKPSAVLQASSPTSQVLLPFLLLLTMSNLSVISNAHFLKALATSQWNMIPHFPYWLIIPVIKKLFAGVDLCSGRDSTPQQETKHKHIQDLYTG